MMTMPRMMTMRYAFKLGLRGTLRHPRTTILAILLLALGLAAVMSMFTLLSMLSSKPLPGVSDHLYQGWVDSRQAPTSRESKSPTNELPFLWKLADAEAMMALQPQVRQAALTSSFHTLSDDGGIRKKGGLTIIARGPMPNIFGVPLRRGRFWTQAEERDHAPVIVITEDTARDRKSTRLNSSH